MSDPWDDQMLRHAFGEVYQQTLHSARPAGAQAAIRSSRRRHQRRVLVTALAVALLLAIPAAVYAAVTGRPATVPLLPATPSPSPTASQSPSAPPSASPSSPASAVEVLTPATAGAGVLANSTITLDWSWLGAGSCVSGATTFVKGVSANSAITSVGLADIDHDGVTDVVATVRCNLLVFGPTEVVALTQVSGTTYRTIGVIEHTEATGSPTDGGVGAINKFALTGTGSVQVEVGSRTVCCGDIRDSVVLQQRGYVWSGGAFSQTSGPTTFTGDTTATDLHLSIPQYGLTSVGTFWTGTVRVTVVNNGPQAATDVRVALFSPEDVPGFDRTKGDWSHCPDGSACLFGTVAAGQSVTYTLPVRFGIAFNSNKVQPVGYAYLLAGEFTFGSILMTARLA